MSQAAPPAARPTGAGATASTGGASLLVLLGTLTAIGPLSLDMYPRSRP